MNNFWTIYVQRLINPNAQDSADIPKLMTYLPSSKPHFILGAFSLGLVGVLLFTVIHSSSALETFKPKTNQSLNSQHMPLLRSTIAAEVPRAVGGPDAPAINEEEALLHSGIGPVSSTVTNVEQDEDGISYYIVQEGDTISEVAELFGVSMNTLIWENDLGKSLKVGQELRILPVTGIRHKIAKGDTISSIAKKYEVEEEDITVFNRVNESSLVVGASIIVPNGVKKEEVKEPTKTGTASGGSKGGTSSGVSNGYFVRPTGGSVSSTFGPRWGKYHYGIDYAAPTGTPIVAAASGTVVKVGCGSGYGTCLIIQHDNGLQTLYAHASALYVSNGATVKQGQKIAAVGKTGNVTGEHLHFEIIKSNGQKLNPSNYIR